MRVIVLLLFLAWSSFCFSQHALQFDAKTVEAYTPFLLSVHKGPESLSAFKMQYPHEYLLQLWYFSSSFYIRELKENQGPKINPGLIDIRRFEHLRQENSEVVIPLTGFSEEAVLLPTNKLLYKLPDEI
ncbi:MAG: hypothetical protein ACO259_08020 [Bacteroidia bacterium]|jgi:hypothetical protein